MAGTRSANFCKLLHVDKVSLYTCFQQINDDLDLHFPGQTFESSTLGNTYMIILQMVTGRTNTAVSIAYVVTCGLFIGKFTFDLGPF